jgi:protein SCO1/2
MDRAWGRREQAGRTLTQMRPRNRFALPLLAAVLLIALFVAIAIGGSPGGSSPKTFTASPATGFDGAAIPSTPAPDFTLTDQNGKRIKLSSLRGGAAVLTFLYSSCGGLCVVIAEQIRGALDELPHRVPVLIVSANPQADTPANVRRFLTKVSLTGRVHYLSGPLSQLRSIWKNYRVVLPTSGQQAFASHASVLLIDPKGEERVLFESEELTPEELSHDIGKLEGP